MTGDKAFINSETTLLDSGQQKFFSKSEKPNSLPAWLPFLMDLLEKLLALFLSSASAFWMAESISSLVTS